jgi:hypothetical protein
MAASHRKPSRRQRMIGLKSALEPIYLIALVNAVVCWSACWFFWDRFEFSATLFGLGCFPIVVAVSAYLYLLTNRVDRT